LLNVLARAVPPIQRANSGFATLRGMATPRNIEAWRWVRIRPATHGYQSVGRRNRDETRGNLRTGCGKCTRAAWWKPQRCETSSRTRGGIPYTRGSVFGLALFNGATHGLPSVRLDADQTSRALAARLAARDELNLVYERLAASICPRCSLVLAACLTGRLLSSTWEPMAALLRCVSPLT